MLQIRQAASVARECSKKFVQQGRSPFDARSVLSVRERERREERQACEPEGQAKWRPQVCASRPGKARERRWRLFSTFPLCKRVERSTRPVKAGRISVRKRISKMVNLLVQRARKTKFTTKGLNIPIYNFKTLCYGSEKHKPLRVFFAPLPTIPIHNLRVIIA